MKLNREDIEEARKAGGRVRIKFTEDLDEATGAQPEAHPGSVSVILEAKDGTSKPVRVRVETIHAGLTRNYTYYMDDKLKASASTWLSPYNKPSLTHHNKYGEPIGRVLEARYVAQSLVSGKGCVEILCEITDPIAAQKVRDGRYLTVSIGAETDSVKCSICGIDLLNEGWCDHYKGEKYDAKGHPDPDGNLCYWIIGNLNFDEISFVNIPSDPHAMVVGISEAAHGESASQGQNPKADKTDEKEEANLTIPSGLTEALVVLLDKVPDELKEFVQALQQKTTALESGLAEVQAQNQQLLETQKSQEDLERDFATLKQEKEAWTAERDSLVSASERMSAKYRESIIDRIIDQRVALGKDQGLAREELVARYAERPLDSLLYALEDLADEKPVIAVTIPPKVSNPGAGVSDSRNKQETTEGDDGNAQVLTPFQAMERLHAKKRGQRR